ncbi:MAG: arginyltransferase, partial [Campylobacter sp.]|nr:arginyltransferase [Campylobacter sp.]
IYCFYDPDFSHLSLGKFSLLNEIKMAQDYGLEYIYLGYWVKKCQSLSYKADYTPSEILRGTSLPCEKWPLWEGKNADCSEPRNH